jgi:uncharacterized protein
MRISLVLTFLLALTPLAVSASSAQSRQKGPTPLTAPAYSHGAEREKVNENVLMLLGGTLGGPWIQMAQEVSTVVDDGDNLRVIPLAGGGGRSNLRDVLLLRGVDLGITRLDVINDAKASGELGPNLDRRIVYIAPLAVDMLQVLARPDIDSLKDLHGKKVNIVPKGSVIPSLLKALDVEIDEVNLTIPEGIEQMRNGKIHAAACVCSVPIPAYRSVSADLGFKLLEVPYVAAIEQSYLPASLSSETYPNLIAKGSTIHTVGSHLVLITYNWTPGTDRHKRIGKFVHAFFSKFNKLREPPRHPSWREVNLAANLRGWQRFSTAQQWIDRQKAEAAAREKALPSSIDAKQVRDQAAKVAPDDAAEQERLFQEFMAWRKRQNK